MPGVAAHYRGGEAGQVSSVHPGTLHVIARYAHPPQWAIELDRWIDLAFLALCVGALTGLLVHTYALVCARWRREGIDGALERARDRYGIRRS